MKLGIMQPYFLPYIGYWQLLNVVDKYVIFDDVHYINRGWINRNRILTGGNPAYLNLPVRGASQNKRINEIEINHDKRLFDKALRTVELAYKRAPFYSSAFPLLCEIMGSKEQYLSGFIGESLKLICGYLGIRTELYLSSALEKDDTLKGQEKILDICTRMKASEYYNAIGGQKLYSAGRFYEKGVLLKFLRPNAYAYRQFDNEFQKDLSILDVMMFNSVDEIKAMLENYTLITGSDRTEDVND